MKGWIITGLALIFLLSGRAQAETILKAEVDKKSITAGELLTYKITVISSEKNIPRPQPPKLEGFRIVSQAQSSTVSLAQNKLRTVLNLIFILAAQKEGKISIGPATLKIKNRLVPSQSFEIEVKPGKPHSLPESAPQASPVEPQDLKEQDQVTL